MTPEALRRVAADLDALGRPWATAGGLAVSNWALPRLIHDIDVALAVADGREAEATVHALLAHGWQIGDVVEQSGRGDEGQGACERGNLPLTMRSSTPFLTLDTPDTLDTRPTFHPPPEPPMLRRALGGIAAHRGASMGQGREPTRNSDHAELVQHGARAFVQRDWNPTLDRDRELPASAAVAERIVMAIALYEGAQATLPGWPSDLHRRADLAAH